MRLLVLALLSLVVARAASPAFTAGNTVSAGRSGDGAAAMGRYTLSNVVYALNNLDPQSIDTVRFSLSSAPKVGSTIRARLASTSTVWYPCTFSGSQVSCTTTGPQDRASGFDWLDVVVAD